MAEAVFWLKEQGTVLFKCTVLHAGYAYPGPEALASDCRGPDGWGHILSQDQPGPGTPGHWSPGISENKYKQVKRETTF